MTRGSRAASRPTRRSRRQPRLSAQDQAILDRLVRESESQYGPYSDAQRDRVREDFRLQLVFPGRYIAFIDRVVRQRGKQRLKRLVVAVGEDFVDVDRKVRKLPKVCQHPDLNYRLVDDPAVVPNEARAS